MILWPLVRFRATVESAATWSNTAYNSIRLNDFQTGLEVESGNQWSASSSGFLFHYGLYARSELIDCRVFRREKCVTISRKITAVQYGVSRMVEPFTGSTVLLALAALAAFAVAVIALKIAIKLAVRIGIVAAIVLAALWATGSLGVIPGV